MKARIIILLAAGLLALACTSENKEQPRFSVNTKVKQIEQFSADQEYDFVAVFDSEGNAESVWYYNGPSSIDTLAGHRTPKRAKEKNHLKFQATHGKFRYRESNEYNPDGLLTTQYLSNTDDVIDGRYEYDYEGDKLAATRFYGMNNEILNEWVNTRHDGKVTVDFYREGEWGYKAEQSSDGLVYDEVISLPDADSMMTIKTHYEKLAEGRPTRIISDDMDVSVEYNDLKLPVHTVNTRMNTFCEIFYTPDLEDFPERWYAYKYDDKGNWVSRTEYTDADLTQEVATITRKITY